MKPKRTRISDLLGAIACMLIASSVFAAKERGGGNLMPDGQTVDQYLYEHTISVAELKKAAEPDLSVIRQKVPGFAKLLEAAFDLRTWYNVDAPLSSLPISATSIPFETIQGAIQDNERVIFSKLYMGNDLKRKKYTADLIVHELVKAALWEKNGSDDARAVLEICGPLFSTPMASAEKIQAILKKHDLNYVIGRDKRNLAQIVALNHQLHDDYLKVAPAMAALCQSFGAEMTEAGFSAAMSKNVQQQLQGKLFFHPASMVHFSSDSDRIAMQSKANEISQQILENQVKFSEVWKDSDLNSWCDSEDADELEGAVFLNYPEMPRIPVSLMNDGIVRNIQLPLQPRWGFEFPLPESTPYSVCSSAARGAAAESGGKWAEPYVTARFDENGDNGYCSMAYILKSKMKTGSQK